MKRLIAILGLTLAAGSSAFASSIMFYLNTDETTGIPPANTIEVVVTLLSTGPDNEASVEVVNNDPSDATYDVSNLFLNVNGASEIGSCTSGVSPCSGPITGTPSGNTYYFVSNQSGGIGGPMTYNVVNTGTAATTITVDVTATGGNSWASASNVLIPNSSGYEAAADLPTQSGYQVAGAYASPEPSGMLLLGAGLLGLGLWTARKRRRLVSSL